MEMVQGAGAMNAGSDLALDLFIFIDQSVIRIPLINI